MSGPTHPTVDHSDRPFSLLRRRSPRWADQRTVVLKPGETLACELDLHGAVIVLEHGQVALETISGHELNLEEGAVFYLSRLPVVVIRNVGSGLAVLAAIRRPPRASQ